MATLAHLPSTAPEAERAYLQASERVNACARQVLIGELLRMAYEQPTIKAFTLAATDAYDDEGDWILCLDGGLDLGASSDDGADAYWTEDLMGHWTMDALLDLFSIEDHGDGLLTVTQLRALASHEGVEV